MVFLLDGLVTISKIKVMFPGGLFTTSEEVQ